MKQITKSFSQRLLLILSIITLPIIGNAQVFNNGQGPSFSNPLPQACPSDTFNEFFLNIFFNEDQINSSNEFIIELSNPDGTFPDNPIEISTPQSFTSSPANNVLFELPEDTAGDNYRVRVRSTDPVATSFPSSEFAAYFRPQTTPFSINGGPTDIDISFCPNIGFTLEIDQITDPSVGVSSPRDFPNLTYNWFRTTTSGTVQIATGVGPIIEVQEEGEYYSEVNYGSCPESPESNRLTLIFADDGGDPANVAITSSLGNPFCSDDTGTVLSVVTGADSYEWFLNQQEIAGETGSTIQATQSGNYAVIITTGGCTAVGSIELENLGGTSTIDVPAVSFIEIGTPVTATVTTTLQNPQFEWFLNGELIDGATENVFTAIAIGSYRVVITPSGECTTITELFFELSALVDVDNIPNTISPNGDGINDIWMIPAQYVSGTNTEVVIISSSGETVLQTNDYENNWPENIDALGSGNQVFYYTIESQTEDIIVGSITVLK